MPQQIEEPGPGFLTDPRRYYRQWSERGPVHKVRFPDGRIGWVVTGYAEGRAALADPRLLKSGANGRWAASAGEPAAPPSPPRRSHMLDSDPPDHTRLRRLVASAFTAGAVDRLRPRIAAITAGLLDRMSGELDLVEAFALPLPVTVIGELLGVADADRIEFRTRSDAMMRDMAPGTMASLMELLSGLVAAKRADPADDVLSALVHARDDGDRLDEQELTRMAFLLLFAGYETTTSLLGSGVDALLRAPDQLARLRADPTLAPAAVEELLRHGSPVDLATLRYAGEPVRIADAMVAPGEFVHVAIGAANRDPCRFAGPDRLDLDRTTAGHLAFGHGIHHCLGAPLARAEAEIALTALFARFPGLRLADPDAVPDRAPGLRVHSLRTLPVVVG